MEKLELKDIELLGEGHQVKRYIEATYGKVADFYDTVDFPVSLKSVRTYLSEDKIKSNTFKNALVRILDKGYYDIVTPMTAQIKKYVWDINENIKLYKAKDDYKIFDKLLDAAKREELIMEAALMYRAKGTNCYYINRINETIEWYERAIALLKDYDTDKLVLMHAELADLCYRENKLQKANAEFKNAEAYIKKFEISKDTLYKYYYWRGIMLNNTEMHSKARNYFIKAYNIIDEKEQKAAALSNIALAYRREAKYKEALEHYSKVLGFYDDSELIPKGVVYNNIAYVYLEQGELKDALMNCVKALAYASLKNDFYHKLAFGHTFIRIKIRMGDMVACKEYFEMLKDTIYKHVDRRKIVEDIKTLIEDLNDLDMLDGLSEAIIELVENSDDKEYELDLCYCLGIIKVKETHLSSKEVI